MIFNSREELAEYDPAARCHCPECLHDIRINYVRLPGDRFGFTWWCGHCSKAFDIRSCPPVKEVGVLFHELDKARHDWAEAIMDGSRQHLSRIPFSFINKSWGLLKTDPISVYILVQKVLLPKSYVLEAWDISEESGRTDIQVEVIEHQFISLDIVFELWSRLSNFDKAVLVGQDVFKYIAMDRLPLLLTDESDRVQIYAKGLLERLRPKVMYKESASKSTSNFIIGPTSYMPA